MIKKILIANRGEIALRIHRACHEMDIKTVAIHSTTDHNAKHVRLADESVCIGPPPLKDSYLNMHAVLSAAIITGTDAIHPGYGLLSENAEFAAMVEEHSIIFIGPNAKHIQMMGDKATAKKTMQKLGVAVVPGITPSIKDNRKTLEDCNKIGYPVIIKASSGGGGKGMQVVYHSSKLLKAIEIAKTEAKLNFGNDRLIIEKFLPHPRHIEMQILGDQYGNVIHLGERDCSIQRNHQKIWEEAPSSILNDEQRKKLGKLAVKICKKINYYNAGTLEFLYDKGNFYFIEMNTRIQVEHPVTEMITDIDIIKQQIRIADNKKFHFKQKDIKIAKHSIECRINAEDPKTFTPSPGKITAYHPPGGLGVRVDSAIYTGYTVPNNYDSLIAKLIVVGENRTECLKRLQRSLEEFVIDGIKTNIPLHRQLVQNADILNNNYHVYWLKDFIKR